MLKQSLDSKVIVVFAGDTHIKFEQQFFEQVLKLKPVVKKTHFLKQCVHVSQQQWKQVTKHAGSSS
jgi:hypothetical protein